MRAASGLTLVEVLVALVVAALAAASLAASAAATLRARAESARRHAMATIAGRALEDLVALAPDRLAPLDAAEEVRHEAGAFVLARRVAPGPGDDLWRLEAIVAPVAGGAPLRLWTLARGPWRSSP